MAKKKNQTIIAKKDTKTTISCCGCNGMFWGWFWLLLGGYFLAQQLGWIPNISIWPILLIGAGAYILLKRKDQS